MNTHASIAARLTEATLADIEGLNPESAGFCRPGCCDPDLPADLPSSFGPLDLHLMIGTPLPPTQWDKLATGISGYGGVNAKLKGEKNAKATLYYRPGGDVAAPAPMLCFRGTETGVTATEFTGVAEGELPFDAKGAVEVDRSEERFVFVCSHKVRDERCGYCGPVIVDLMRQAVAARYGDKAPIRIFPCSHVGGHAYAGNVLVYSKHGGRCFGCVTPENIDELVDYVAVHKDAKVPKELRARLRGTMGPAVPSDETA